MTYLEMLSYLYNERPSGKVTLGLERIRELLRRLESPERGMKLVHIAGTNGKGSTTKMIHVMQSEHGLRTAGFFSPHLSTFRERIIVNGNFVGNEVLLEAFRIVNSEALKMDAQGENTKPSFFEFVTAMAFVVFHQMKTQAGAIEVGLGGRFDATNTISPVVSTITTIDYDHTKILGNTLEKIAFEKCGIVKPKTPVVCGESKSEALQIVRKTAQSNESPLFCYGSEFFADNVKLELGNNEFDFFGLKEFRSLRLSLNGVHQIVNASTALQAFLVFAEEIGLEVDENAIRRALKNVVMPGRFEVICETPLVVIDGAHNKEGAVALEKCINTYLSGRDLTVVIGILDDKDKEAILSRIAPLASNVVVTRPKSHRAIEIEETYEIARKYSRHSEMVDDPIQAYKRAVDLSSDVVLITGSLYLVGYLRDYIAHGTVNPEWSLVR